MIYKLNWDKYDWRKFEKICYEYIKTIYSAKFYRTKLTRATKDSGRDIIIKKIGGEFEAWGECKNHKRNIDLSVLGKNVVLALSHQINKAIFFSVTEITANTKIEILSAAQKNGFEVLFLDGDELNAEILNCEKVAKKYFREEYEQYIKHNKSNVWADVLVSEYPFAEDARNNAKKQYHLKNSFQIFLHLFVKNMNSCDISNISIELTNIPHSDVEFFEHEHQWSNGLRSYSDLLYTFRGIVFSPKKNISMPDVVVKYTFLNGSTCEDKIITGTVDASDIWKAPYINSKTTDLFANATDILEKVVPENYVRVFYLYGKSGMGKSRLINEFELKAYENEYRVIHVDFREMEEVSALRSFLMALLGMPFSKSKLHLAYSDFSKVYADKLYTPDIHILYDFLYSEHDTYEGLSSAIINLLVKEAEEDKILLSIDNIQELSSDLQRIFWSVLQHCHNTSIPVCFIFANNIERQKDESNVLRQYLESVGDQYENFVISYHCDVLEENNAVLLMQQLLHLSSESDAFIKKLLSKMELCPMDILLLSKSLEQMPGLLQSVNGNRYIVNTNSFSLDKYELPETFDSVARLRVSNLLDNVNDQEKYRQLFYLIVFFEGTLRMDIFDKCLFDMDMLYMAKQNLIIRVNEIENTIHFYHEKIYQFIKKDFSGLTTSIINSIYDHYFEIEDKTIVDYYFFIKILLARKNIDEAVRLGLEILEQYKNSTQGRYVIKICDILQEVISQSKNPTEYFTVIFLKADLLLERINISKAEELFEESKEIINMHSTLFSSEVVIHFFHRYINQKLHTLQYERAFAAFAEFEDLSESIELNSKASMIINDRRCVALYSLGREAEALAAINDVIKTATDENNTIWLSIAYSDSAFCRFYNSKDVSKICADFSKAIDYYEKGENYDDISREIEIQIQKTIVNILNHDYKKAESTISRSIQTAEAADYGYLLIPSYNIQAYIMIMKNHMETAWNILKKSFEYANMFSNPKAIVSIYNNCGSICVAAGKHQEAFNYYQAGLETLKKICTPQNSFRYMGLLSNIVKLSIILDKAQTVAEVIDTYNFEDLRAYKEKCQKTLSENNNLSSFSHGLLSCLGYDYLY